MMGYTPDASNDFDVFAYGMKHPTTVAWLQQGMQQVVDYLTPIGQQFVSNAKQLFEQYNGSEAMRRARAALGRADARFQVEVIVPMNALAQFQQASLVMQRWLMANPMVGKMAHEQRINGYSQTYQEPQPGVFGEDNYNYRRVMNGIMVDHDDGSWSSTTWSEDLFFGDRELVIDEQHDIIHTAWPNIENLIRRGLEDPTDAEGGSL